MAVSSIGTNLQTPECSIQLTDKASIPEYMYVSRQSVVKQGVPENPLPVAPETWNFFCYRFGQRLDALQNFRSLTQF